MHKNQAVLVLSGYNIRAVIAFCRWADAHGINFHLVARNDADPIFLTRYRNRVILTRENPDLKPVLLRSWIEAAIRQFGYRRVLVLPVSEYFNRALLAYRDEIEGEDCVIPLVERELYERISDKEKFARLCASYGLDIPDEYETMPERPPFVAKPRGYFSRTGRQLAPQLIRNQTDLARFRQEQDARDFFFQEFVNGRNLYLLAYISKTGNDLMFSQENLMQQSGGKSIILARKSEFHTTAVALRYIDMLHDINFSGLIMIEVRQEMDTGRYKMIEANPRLWGPMQFIVDNDIDLFGQMLAEHGFEVPASSIQPRHTDFYFWSGGISKAAQPVAFFNYSADQFVADLPDLRSQDIFFRHDTLNLFLKEAALVDGP